MSDDSNIEAGKKIPAPAVKRPGRSHSDEKTEKEVGNLLGGKTEQMLARESREAEARRNEAFRDHFEKIAIWALYLIGASIVAAAGIWLYHLLAPECYRWLTKEQVDRIQDVVTGGIIVGIVSGHLKKRLSD